MQNFTTRRFIISSNTQLPYYKQNQTLFICGANINPASYLSFNLSDPTIQHGVGSEERRCWNQIYVLLCQWWLRDDWNKREKQPPQHQL